ncbi:unnamed protein product [Natator depressus]
MLPTHLAAARPPFPPQRAGAHMARELMDQLKDRLPQWGRVRRSLRPRSSGKTIWLPHRRRAESLVFERTPACSRKYIPTPSRDRAASPVRLPSPPRCGKIYFERINHMKTPLGINTEYFIPPGTTFVPIFRTGQQSKKTHDSPSQC